MSENLFIKANMSALAGLPISFLVNLSILPLFSDWFSNPETVYLGASLVAIPFYITSVSRMYIIDLVYQKYGININPSVLIKRLFKKD
jgi:hypothetical protein